MIHALNLRAAVCGFCLLLLIGALHADEPKVSDEAKFAEGVKTWQKVKQDCQGNYSYKMRFESWVGFGHVTEIVVRRNKVAERRYEQFNSREPVPVRGQPADSKGWVEKGDDLGTHEQGAPVKTLDELYAEGEKIAVKKLAPSERRYVRLDKQGLPIACFYVDTNIADDAPTIGVNIASIQVGE